MNAFFRSENVGIQCLGRENRDATLFLTSYPAHVPALSYCTAKVPVHVRPNINAPTASVLKGSGEKVRNFKLEVLDSLHFRFAGVLFSSHDQFSHAVA